VSIAIDASVPMFAREERSRDRHRPAGEWTNARCNFYQEPVSDAAATHFLAMLAAFSNAD